MPAYGNHGIAPYCGITNAEPLPRKPNPELVGAAVVVAPGSTVTFVAMIYFQRLSWFCNLTFERPKRPASGTTPCAFGAAFAGSPQYAACALF